MSQLNIKKFIVNPIQENMYVVSDDSLEAVIIDCGAFYPAERQAVVSYLQTSRLKPVHLLCTHGHLDHCFGNITIYQHYGLKAEVCADDEFLITQLSDQARGMFGFQLQDQEPPVGTYLTGGDTICFGTHTLSVIPTPGHTPGSCVFYCKEEAVAFTGDTLFRMSVGRTDFERGSYSDLMQSMQRLRELLPPETRLLAGHGPDTTMSAELRDNPYLRMVCRASECC